MNIIAKGADTILKQKAPGISIDVGNYRLEMVLPYFVWVFALQAKLRSHRKYRAKFKKLNRLIFPLYR
jgi:hypothetical protein